MNSDIQKPSRWLLILYATFTLGFTVSAFYSLINEAMSLSRNLLTQPPKIDISKGAFYGAAGFGSMVFLYGFIVLLISQDLTDRHKALMGKLLITSVVLMLTLPHAVHYPAAAYLESRGYEECKPQSQRWLHDRTIVYTQTSAQCLQLVIDKCREWPSSEQCGYLKKAGVPERLWRPERK